MRSRYTSEEEAVSYWPSVSDLFMTLFIVALAFSGGVLFVFLPNPAGSFADATVLNPLNRVRTELQQPMLSAESANQQQVIEALEEILVALQQHTAARNHLANRLADHLRIDDKPPIITISDAERQHFFTLGSASLTTEFLLDLNSSYFEEIAQEILARNHYNLMRVNTLEIIGHTDGIPVGGRGNLDLELPALLSRQTNNLSRLSPGSNNDLGLLRALAIQYAWQKFVAQHPQQEQLAMIAVRVYSAGQTQPIQSGIYNAEDARARRIEMRLTMLEPESEASR